MVRGTTLPVTLKVKGADLTTADSVYVSIKQINTSFLFTGEELNITLENVGDSTNSIITFVLTQAQSLKLLNGFAKVQVNWLYTDDGTQYRNATTIAEVDVAEQLLCKVVSNND